MSPKRNLIRRQRKPTKSTLRKSPLNEAQIFAWAKAHFERTGSWPNRHDGAVADVDGESWHAIDAALYSGSRGLPGGSSLSRILVSRRVKILKGRRPLLTNHQILDWAEAFFKARGRWPNVNSGAVDGVPGDTWWKIDAALRAGLRGLTGDHSLAQLLGAEKRVRIHGVRPPLTVPQILDWADAFFGRNGTWPKAASGPVGPGEEETWAIVDSALRHGTRGLAGKSSLSRILKRWRGVRPRGTALSESQIFEWATEHFQRTGLWPSLSSGAVVAADGETWAGTNTALVHGLRGLPSGSSLSKLLVARRVKKRQNQRPLLTVQRVLDWADGFFKSQGRWPQLNSGPVPEVPGEDWANLDKALRDGLRGLPSGLSLPRLLLAERGVKNLSDRPPLTAAQILEWTDEYYRRNGTRPTFRSGSIKGSKDDTWETVNAALRFGSRGLPGKSSLSRLLKEHRPAYREKKQTRESTSKPITLEQIRTWAKDYYQRTGVWPHAAAGPIPGTDGVTWRIVDGALRHGKRGLPAGSSLAKLFGKKSPREA